MITVSESQKDARTNEIIRMLQAKQTFYLKGGKFNGCSGCTLVLIIMLFMTIIAGLGPVFFTGSPAIFWGIPPVVIMILLWVLMFYSRFRYLKITPTSVKGKGYLFPFSVEFRDLQEVKGFTRTVSSRTNFDYDTFAVLKNKTGKTKKIWIGHIKYQKKSDFSPLKYMSEEEILLALQGYTVLGKKN